MRQLILPFYQPCFCAPERAVLTLLHAALRVTEQSLHDEHPTIASALVPDEHHASLVAAAAKLIVGRCAELRALLDFYDAAVDEVIPVDEAIHF